MSDTEERIATGGLREGEKEQAEERSVRRKVLTDKGKEYQVGRMEERVESTTRNWGSVARRIRSTLKDIFSPSDLKSKKEKEN